MPDLISRDALKQFPVRRDHYDEENGNENFISGVESVLEYAEQLPTVDAVRVVRCKEYKWYVENGVCEWYSTNATKVLRLDDDFCSDGERRADNEAD